MRRAALVALALVAGACSYRTPPVALTLPERAQSSTILAADGSVVTVLHAEENRQDVPLDRMAPVLRDAVVAIEDSRFWSHNGVDLRAIARAATRDVSAGAAVEGGSTITQQYVKNALVGDEDLASRKLQEAVVAVELERHTSKERILELYLNTVYFGNGAYGAQAAAEEYFGTAAADLTLAQAATLAGLIRSPSATDPYEHPDVALARRDVVLHRMADLGVASPAAVADAEDEPLGLVERPETERYPAPHFVEVVKRFVLDDPRFGATRAERRALLFTGGLRVFTTVDLRLQAAAEAAVDAIVTEPDRDPTAALVAMDPATGAVRALVGGRDFFGTGPTAKFDLATQGRRPAGSSFKPLVLAAALEEGASLADVHPAPPHLSLPVTGGVWEVDNYDGVDGGQASLLDATVWSYNTVYAQVIQEVGSADAVRMAARLGVASPLQAVPSAVLGANDVSPLDMAAAFSTLAAGGVRRPPVFVTRVEGPDGEVLYEAEPAAERVVDERVAAQVTSALQQVVERGTGERARLDRPAAGKTGTGQDWGDAWFVGYTPHLAASVWVGFPEEQVSMQPPRTRELVTGGTWPAEIWRAFMADALDGVPPESFDPPPDGAPVARPAGAPDGALEDVRRVVGMPAGPAEDLLTRAGFVVVRTAVPADDYPPGYVEGQDPAPGALVPAGATVALRVATDAAAVATVPPVLGLPVADATAAVRRAAFQVEVVEAPEPSVDGPAARAGLVWRQDPAGGAPAARGGVVRLWVDPAPG